MIAAPHKDAPLVTGVAPKEGPPGTRIVIRGENFGKNAKDFIALKICMVDCYMSAEWLSPSKIVARTGPGKGKGDVLITTKLAGRGSCTIGFRGYFLPIGPLQESAVWIDESQSINTNFGHVRPASPMLVKEDEDPLGISDEGNQAKFKEAELLEIFPEASGNMSLKNFLPAWYLLENHHGTNFDDLKSGLAFMKRKATARSEGPIAFAKSNLATTVDCLDSIEAMNKSFSLDDIRGDKISSYAVLLVQAKSCADGLFQKVLSRKDKAESTRSALSVLQRFRFLFYLPLNMERNIQKGDYNLVINDYIRAKSLFADTQVQVFRKVYSEVVVRINLFRDMLQSKLMELPNSLEDQKKLIRYLSNLEARGDPAWECLVNQQTWLVSILNKCKETHVAKQAAIQSSESEETQIPAMRKSLVAARDVGIKATTRKSAERQGWKYKTPQKVMFIDELTDLMTKHVPDLWKLGQAYFGGNLLVKESVEKAFKIDTSKHLKFKQMVSEIICLFANLIRAAFLPESLENIDLKERQKYGLWVDKKQNIPGAWLPSCVRYVRSFVSSLSGLDLPGDATDLLHELAFDMRTSCLFTLLKKAIEDVKLLHTRETWVVDTDDENGGITHLPALFENIVSETIQHLHEVVIQIREGETEIFSQRTIQKDATLLCTRLLQAFAACLDHLAFTEPEKTEDPTNSLFMANSDGEVLEDTVPQLDKRLIVMWSDCHHTLQRVIPRLVENLEKHGYMEMNKTLTAAQTTFIEVEHKLFEAYVEEKSNPIVGAMEQGMYRGGFDWNQCPKPNGARSYLKEVMMGMIEVHAEVFAICPGFLNRVMSKVVDAVAEEMSRLIVCSPGFNREGALQARMELNALQDAVTLYKSTNSVTCFKEALDCLPELGDDKKTLEGLLNLFKSQMRFQLLCFQNESVMRSSSVA